MGRGMVRRTTCRVPGSLKGRLPASTPTSRGLRPPPSVPPPPYHHTHLCYRSWRGAGRPARGETARGSWRGVGRAGPRLLAPRAWSPACSTLGKGCRGSPKRGGERAESRAEMERSLPPTLVHRADPGRPQPGRLGRGEPAVAAAPSFWSRASSLSLSLIPTPSPLLQDDVSTARRGLMGPLANRVAGGARCCRAGGSQWDWGAGAGGRVRAFSPDCNLGEQGNCGGWGGSWKAVEEVGEKRDRERIAQLEARGWEEETSNGDLKEARRDKYPRHPTTTTTTTNSALTSFHSPFHQQDPAGCLLGTAK